MSGCIFTLVNLWKSEEAHEQIILVIDGQISGEAETLLQPEHRFETRECSACRIEGLKPPVFGMFFFTRKWSLSMRCWRCFVT